MISSKSFLAATLFSLSLVLNLNTTAVFAQPSNQESTKPLTVDQKRSLKEKEIDLKRYIYDNPRVPEAHLNLGNIYWDQGRSGKPIRHYLAAIKLNPEFAEAYYNLGNVFFREGEYDQALQAYRKAIEIKPSYADAHNGLGNAYIDKKKYNDAIDSYRRAIQVKPSHREAIYNLCTANLYAANYSEAIESCEKATESSPDSRSYNNLGNAYFRSKQFDSALSAYRKALSFDPELPEAHFNIAAISLVYSKNKQEALNREKILKVLDPQKGFKLSKLIEQSGI